MHAHLDQYAKAGTDCKDPSKGCYGGYARIKTKVDELRSAHPDHLWLNAGDEFQGTLFYSFYKGEKIGIVLNDLKFDVMTLGNHEWDGGDEQLGAFLKNLTFPIVSCNVKSKEKNLNETIKNYHIFKDYDLAVIGATTDTTPSISNVGKDTKFTDPIEEVQKAIWEIRNTTDIKRIIALTHIGYDVDQKLAEETEGLSLIIGGHSHTLLGDMQGAEGKYPTIVKDKTGQEVFIVTSYRWGEYLGNIDLTFDKDGRALRYHGAPIHMDNTTKLDPDLQEKIHSWRGPFEKFAAEVVGTTKNDLGQSNCKTEDCLLGQVMADAMLDYKANLTKGSDPKPDFAMLNGGGVRATIGAGNITRGDVITAFPFGNAVVEIKIAGKDLRKVLEGAVSRVNQFNDKKVSSTIQVSKGLNVQYNPANPAGKQLLQVTINGKVLDDSKDYHVVATDFVAGGGDNIVEPSKDFATLDALDEVLVGYVQKNTPLESQLDKRIAKSDKATGGGDQNSTSGGDDKGGGDNKDGKNAASGFKIPATLLVTLASLMMMY